MSFAPKIILNLGFYLNGEIRRMITLSDTIPFEFKLFHSITYSLLDMVQYEVLIISGEFRVFLITRGLQPCINISFLMDLLIMSCFLFWIRFQFALHAIL